MSNQRRSINKFCIRNRIMSEKFCLQWDDFQGNIKEVLGMFKGDLDFADVTLACEDGHQVEANKIILAASSPLFLSLLKRNKHSHPIIYLRGMKAEDLNNIVDFLYHGEADIYQENLESFLALAEELQLRGIADQLVEKQETNLKPVPAQPKQLKGSTHKKLDSLNIKTEVPHDKETLKDVKPLSTAAGDFQELEEKVMSMIEKGQKKITVGASTVTAFICKECGKEGMKTDIKRHIESFHVEGVSIPCNFCGAIFRSRKGLKSHLSGQYERTM